MTPAARESTPAARLVVDGDDAGFHADTDRALLDAARSGVLTAVSLVAGGPTVAAFVEAALPLGLSLGLHLNLSDGRPLARRVPSLVDGSGAFFSPKARAWEAASRFSPDDVAREVEAQWRALGKLGARPDHLDGHNHVHLFAPVLDGIVLALGSAARLFVRCPEEPECPEAWRPALPACALGRAAILDRLAGTAWRLPDRFAGLRFSHDPSEGGIAHLAAARPGLTEWMVHPGPRPGSPFTRSPRRAEEAAFLARPGTRRLLEDWGYRLTRFEAAA